MQSTAAAPQPPSPRGAAIPGAPAAAASLLARRLAAAAARLLAMHTIAWTALLWLRLAVQAACSEMRVARRRCGPLLCLHTNCVGGYHSELPPAWRELERTVTSAAPYVDWKALPRLTVFFDDQVNYPAETCRASLGFVVAGTETIPAITAPSPSYGSFSSLLGNDNQEEEEKEEEVAVRAAREAWGRHPLVSLHGLRLAVLPAGDCLAADMTCCLGPLSYLICLARALHCLRLHVRATGLHAKVPGLFELRDPRRRRICFLLPLEGRSELLPCAQA